MDQLTPLVQGKDKFCSPELRKVVSRSKSGPISFEEKQQEAKIPVRSGSARLKENFSSKETNEKKPDAKYMIFANGRHRLIKPMSDKKFRKWCRKQRREIHLHRLKEESSESDSWKHVSEKPQPDKASNPNDSCDKGRIKISSYTSGCDVKLRFSSIKPNRLQKEESKQARHFGSENKAMMRFSSMAHQVNQNKALRFVHKPIRQNSDESSEFKIKIRPGSDDQSAVSKSIKAGENEKQVIEFGGFEESKGSNQKENASHEI